MGGLAKMGQEKASPNVTKMDQSSCVSKVDWQMIDKLVGSIEGRFTIGKKNAFRVGVPSRRTNWWHSFCVQDGLKTRTKKLIGPNCISTVGQSMSFLQSKYRRHRT